MSENNPHDAAQTLPQDRETLYHLVWSEPAERITVLYDISTELLAKRCSEMRIPFPPYHFSERAGLELRVQSHAQVPSSNRQAAWVSAFRCIVLPVTQY